MLPIFNIFLIIIFTTNKTLLEKIHFSVVQVFLNTEDHIGSLSVYSLTHVISLAHCWSAHVSHAFFLCFKTSAVHIRQALSTAFYHIGNTD